jgi:hypothetical protein
MDKIFKKLAKIREDQKRMSESIANITNMVKEIQENLAQITAPNNTYGTWTREQFFDEETNPVYGFLHKECGYKSYGYKAQGFAYCPKCGRRMRESYGS